MTSSNAHAYATGAIPVWTFGDKIRKARDITGLDQKAFAQQIDVSASSLAAYETGRTSPRFRDAPQIAKSIQMLTGIPYQWFLVDDEPPTFKGPAASESGTTDYGSVVSPVISLKAARERKNIAS